MASLLENLRSKKRVFFLLVCGYVVVVLLWQLQSSYHPMISSTMDVSHQDVFVWTQNGSNTYNSVPVLDIHIEDPALGHTGEIIGDHLHRISIAQRNRTVAIGGGITSAKIKGLTNSNIVSKVPLFKHLVPSFCKTASAGFQYHFYLGYDQNDAFFTKPDFLKAFQAAFYQCIKSKCSAALQQSTHIHLVQCSHSRKPAWAQNDAMMEAYVDDIEYYYRLNDDTEMQTGQWVEAFIKNLKGYDPPLVGVVGPKHRGGNEAILTYDFVHKTHVDIFGFYYPRLFMDWWADDWVTQVYKPGRSTKLSSINLKHTMELGQRYKTTMSVGAKVKGQIAGDKKTLIRYLQAREQHGMVFADGKKVISMFLYGKDPKYTMGVMRNAQLLPVFLPGWTLRIYTTDPKSNSPDLIVPERILNKLKSLGVQLAFVNPAQVTIPPGMWSMLVADDLEVDYFLIREAHHRLGDRDAAAVNFWLKTDWPFLSIKDHPDHAKVTVVKGLWGASPRDLHTLLGKPMYLTLQKSLVSEELEKNGSLLQKLGSMLTRSIEEDILGKYIWPLVEAWSLRLDSISCQESVDSFPFPAKRTNGEYIGQEYDQHQLPVAHLSSISSPEACSNSELKPSEVPAAPELPQRDVSKAGDALSSNVSESRASGRSLVTSHHSNASISNASISQSESSNNTSLSSEPQNKTGVHATHISLPRANSAAAGSASGRPSDESRLPNDVNTQTALERKTYT